MTTPERTFTPRVIVQLLLVVVLIPLLPLLISWRWDWLEGWIVAIVYTLGFILSRVLAARKHPDIIAERAHSMEREDTKSWDKILAPLLALGGLFILLVAGLDARFGWSVGFSVWVKIAGLIVMIAGYALGSYALIENRYFSGVVRIQTDRNHHVISSGPYRWVRHPGYTGALLTYLGTPLLLDSAWALVPVVFLALVLVIRTRLEDQTLQAELTGYRDYAGRVRYRLLPGVW